MTTNKAKSFRDLESLSCFDAQKELEHELIQGYYKKMASLEPDANLAIQYAKFQGAVEALRALQGTRKTILAAPGVKQEGTQ